MSLGLTFDDWSLVLVDEFQGADIHQLKTIFTRLGENSKIGAGSVVLEEVPPNSTVVGVPGRVVKRENISYPRDDMDQCNLPDPVQEDICNLQRANSVLTNRLLDLEDEMRVLKKQQEKIEQK